MFTGLIKGLGTIQDISRFGNGRRFQIDIGDLATSAEIGQSIAVNGACLTVTAIAGRVAAFDATSESTARTNLAALKPGAKVNLEPAIKVGAALDGHIVQGHVDDMATVLSFASANEDSRIIKISLPNRIRHLVAEKGSIAVDGISLTVADIANDWFTVAVIPLTWKDTTLAFRSAGDAVNLEADVLARYAARILLFGKESSERGVTEQLLAENGFL